MDPHLKKADFGVKEPNKIKNNMFSGVLARSEVGIGDEHRSEVRDKHKCLGVEVELYGDNYVRR